MIVVGTGDFRELDAAGHTLWTQTFPVDGGGTLEIEEIAVGPHGEVAVLAAWGGGNLSVGLDLYPPPTPDGFARPNTNEVLALLEPGGQTVRWSRRLSTTRELETYSILTDGTDVWAAGRYRYDPPAWGYLNGVTSVYTGYIARFGDHTTRWSHGVDGGGEESAGLGGFDASGALVGSMHGNSYGSEADSDSWITYGDLRVEFSGSAGLLVTLNP